MKKDKNILANKLFKYFDELVKNTEMLAEYKTFLKDRGYTEGEVMRVVGHDNPPKTISDINLFMFTLAAEKIDEKFKSQDDKTKIKLNDYFNKAEIEDQAEYYKTKVSKKDEILEFDNVFRLDNRTWTLNAVSIQKLAEYVDNFYIGYDIRYQRETIKKKDKDTGTIREDINLKESKYNEIAEKIIAPNQYFPDPITICLYKTGDEQPISEWWDEKNHKIKIKLDEFTKVKCPDGWHRLSSYRVAVEKKSDVEHYESVTFLYCTEKEVGQYIAQKNYQTPLLPAHAKSYEVGNPYLEIAKAINSDESTNIMFNKMVEYYKDLEIYEDKYCTFEVIEKSIEYCFDIDFKNDPRKERKVKEFIIEGMNEILGCVNDLDYTKENSVCYDNNCFVGYIAILSTLYEAHVRKEKWLEKIDDIITNFTFNRANSDWNETVQLSNPTLNKPALKRITNYFLERSK